MAWPKRLLSSKLQLGLMAAIFLSVLIADFLLTYTIDSFEIFGVKILFSIMLIVPTVASAHLAIGGIRVAFDNLYIKRIFIGLTIMGSIYLTLIMASLSGTTDAYSMQITGSDAPDTIVQISDPLPPRFNRYRRTSRPGHHQYKLILLSHGEGVYHFSTNKPMLPLDLITIPNETIISVQTVPLPYE